METLEDTDPRGQLYRSWQLKELLRMLPHQPVGQAEAELKRWIFRASHSRIPEVVELCRKIRRRRDDILRTIGPGYSNARLEAFNNKINHHPHGLRLPTRRQPHRHDQTPMQRPTHPPTNTHPLTHENNRRLK
ncbi:transposase [Bifidobacterium longum]|uniref:transposase n=1 Tax=Bifidobacterium longum TaxID=216816 RepID=UPI0021E40722|nr:transposase [Bifidobacterium longum]